MDNMEFFEQGIEELNLDDMEQVSGGKKRPFIKTLGNNINVRKGPGTQYAAVAKLSYGDEVAVVSRKTVKDSKGYYWAKVTVSVSQSKSVQGWVCSKHAKVVWY